MRSRVVVAVLVVLIVAASVASYGLGYSAGSSAAPARGVTTIAASLYAPYLSSVLNGSGVGGTVVGMGSVAAARQVILEPSAYGIFLSVDPAVIEDLLVPRGISSWYVAIAGDSMVIGISPALRGSAAYRELVQLNGTLAAAEASGNWTEARGALDGILSIVLSGKYPVGTSDPNTDPEGYRALMVMQLAGIWIHGDSGYYLSRLEALNSSGQLYEVPMGSALFAYLESGRVGFDVALYESSAAQQGIPRIVLPLQVNLGDPSYSGLYSQASVEIVSGGMPVDLHGAPIYICFTIPNQYPGKTGAALAALYMVSPPGQALLRRYGANPLPRALLYGNASRVPYPLSALVNTSVLEYAGPIN
ncbi:MAG: substrate-binding domain-containing protein [Conexivisphaera sp.]